MREIAKSILSYTWALSVFGIQQAANVFRRGQGQNARAAEVFDDVTRAVTDQFDDGLKAAFRAGDNVQRGLVDLMFGGSGAPNPDQWTRTAERMAGAVRNAARAGASGSGTCSESADDGMPPGWSFGRAPSTSGGQTEPDNGRARTGEQNCGRWQPSDGGRVESR